MKVDVYSDKQDNSWRFLIMYNQYTGNYLSFRRCRSQTKPKFESAGTAKLPTLKKKFSIYGIKPREAKLSAPNFERIVNHYNALYSIQLKLAKELDNTRDELVGLRKSAIELARNTLDDLV